MGKATDMALGAVAAIGLLWWLKSRKTRYPAWDINQDGVVDSADLQILQASFGAVKGETGYNPAADLNHDGIVDSDDLLTLTAHLGEDYRPTKTA